MDSWVSLMGREIPMTRFFVGLSIGLYGMGVLSGVDFDIMGGFSGAQALRWGAVTPALAQVEPWRLVSAIFIHFGVLHLGLNMMGLVDLGKQLERLIGSARFATLFVFTGIAGFVLSGLYYATFGSMNQGTGGASGGVFGVIAGLIGYLYARKDPRWKSMFIRLAIYTLLFALMGGAVNNAAHLGGFLAGAPLGYFFYKERRPARLQRLFQGLAWVFAVGSIASVLLTNASDTWRVERAREIQRQGFEPVLD
jgi:rhomboid protease GluP